MEKSMTYAQAIERLEKILSEIKDPNLDIDQLSLRLQEAKPLMDFCRKRLYEVDQEVDKLLSGLALGGEAVEGEL